MKQKKQKEKAVALTYKLDENGKPQNVAKAAISIYKNSNGDINKLKVDLKSQFNMSDDEIDDLTTKISAYDNTTPENEKQKQIQQVVAECVCISNFKTQYGKSHSPEEVNSALEDMQKRAKSYVEKIENDNNYAQEYIENTESKNAEVKAAEAKTVEETKNLAVNMVKARKKEKVLNEALKCYDANGNFIGSEGKNEEDIKKELIAAGIDINDGPDNVFTQLNTAKDGEDSITNKIRNESTTATNAFNSCFPKDSDGNPTYPPGLVPNNNIDDMTEETINKCVEEKKKEADEAQNAVEQSEHDEEDIVNTLKTVNDDKKQVTEKDIENLVKDNNIKPDENSWMTPKQKKDWEDLQNKYKNGNKPDEYAQKSSEMLSKFRKDLKEPSKPEYTLKYKEENGVKKYYKVDSNGNETELSGNALNNAIKDQAEYNMKKQYDTAKSEKKEKADKEIASLQAERKKQIDDINKKYKEDSILDPKKATIDVNGKSVSVVDKNGEPLSDEDLKSNGITDEQDLEEAKAMQNKVKEYNKKQKEIDEINANIDDQISNYDDETNTFIQSEEDNEKDINSVESDTEKEDKVGRDKNGKLNNKPEEPAKWTARVNPKTKIKSYYDENGNRMGSLKSEKVQKHLKAVKRYRKRMAEWKANHPNESLLEYAKFMLNM